MWKYIIEKWRVGGAPRQGGLGGLHKYILTLTPHGGKTSRDLNIHIHENNAGFLYVLKSGYNDF